jgi:anti-sigma B factor antagonist
MGSVPWIADGIPEMVFAVDVTSIEGETVLTLHGELDLWTQPRFLAALAGLDDRVARVVLDLSDLTFIDCGSIGIIQRTRMLAGLRGTSLVLRSPNPQLLRIMDLTGLWPSTGDADLRPTVLPSPSRTHEHAAV